MTKSLADLVKEARVATEEVTMAHKNIIEVGWDSVLKAGP